MLVIDFNVDLLRPWRAGRLSEKLQHVKSPLAMADICSLQYKTVQLQAQIGRCNIVCVAVWWDLDFCVFAACGIKSFRIQRGNRSRFSCSF